MDNHCDIKQLELSCVIVNYGLGSKIIKIAKQNGLSGGTIFLGKGTVKKNHLLELLDITDVRKEIVILISEKNKAYQVLDELNSKIEFDKPHHGIAFALPVKDFFGGRNCASDKANESRGVNNTMYNAIFVIVDKGLAESVLDAATAAGSRGGTIINARGSGAHENQKLFSMAIEPEKEIIMILSEISLTEQIVTSIRKQLKIDDPGNGILFVMDVNKTYGLY